jgi:hypothetical protein
VAHRWRTGLSFARAAPLWTSLASLALVVLPPVAASVAYFRLIFRVDDAGQRYRIATVSASLIVWWVVAVAAGQSRLLDNEAVQLAARVLGVAAALGVLVAYSPPAWVRRRLGIVSAPA